MAAMQSTPQKSLSFETIVSFLMYRMTAVNVKSYIYDETVSPTTSGLLSV